MKGWKLYLVPWLGFVVALSMHLWHLGQPASLTGDEVFFVQDGQSYILWHDYFDPHPPLGKMQLGAIFTYLGYSPITWRILNAVAGAFIVPLLWWLVWRLSKNRIAANLAVIFALLDGFLFVESRLGVINIPYILYSLAGLACTLKALDQRRPVGWLIAAGVLAGMAVSVKWLALFVILPMIAMWVWPHVFGQRKHTGQPLWIWPVAFGCLVLLPAGVYYGVFWVHFAWLGQANDFFGLNQQMVNYQLSVPATGDPYGAPWWGWLIQWQPFLYSATRVGTKLATIWSLPNPWLWWTGSAIFITSLIRGWKGSSTRLLNIFLLATWIPFAFIHRIMYSYHAMLFDVFLLTLIAILLGRLWLRHQRFVIIYTSIAAAVFMWFFPLYANIPLTPTQQRLRQWLPRWKVTTPVTTTTATPRPAIRPTQ